LKCFVTYTDDFLSAVCTLCIKILLNVVAMKTRTMVIMLQKQKNVQC